MSDLISRERVIFLTGRPQPPDSGRGDLSVAVVYPNSYEVGMANMGFLRVFELFSSIDGVSADRAFFAQDQRDELRAMKFPGIRSGKPLSEFDLIAFSVTFEPDWINLVKVLETAGIPLRSADRNKSPGRYPVVLAGGVCAGLNPEPASSFVDAFFIGEAEDGLDGFIRLMRATPRAERGGDVFFESAARLPGFYLPSGYEPEYNPDGTIKIVRTRAGFPAKVKRRIAQNPAEPATLLYSPDTVFGDAYLLETGKGCGRQCRFCAADFVYKPPRFVPAENIIARIDAIKKDILARGGAEKKKYIGRIGFIGSAVCDHPDIARVLEHAVNNGFGVTVSSLRLDAVSADFLELLARGGLQTMTVAPEAGSDRLRRIVGKDVTSEQIADTLGRAAMAGIPNFKMYFIAGLPEERDEDMDAIVSLAERVRGAVMAGWKRRGRAGKMTIGVAPFVPKPATPFEREAMAPPGLLEARIGSIKRRLKRLPNVEFSAEPVRSALLQCLMSLGGRGVGKFIEEAASGRVNPATMAVKWPDTGFIAHRAKHEPELLPWDFIDHGLHGGYLAAERRRAVTKGVPAERCLDLRAENNGCARCGEFAGFCKEDKH